MARISILGRGNVARTLADGWAAAGHEIALGAREPRKSAGHSERGLDEAAAWGEIVVNALPGDICVDLLRESAEALRGKVLIDVANAVRPAPDGQGLSLIHPDGSLAEALAGNLPGCRLVKTLNTVHVSAMARPERLTQDAVAFLSGDDADAKALVRELLVDLGWRDNQVLDIGALSSARATEAFILFAPHLTGALGSGVFAMGIAREKAQPAT